MPAQTPAAAQAPEFDAALVKDRFRRDVDIRAALASGLKARGETIRDAAARAQKAFEKFDPSMLSEAERARGHYLEPGGNLKIALRKVVDDSVERLRGSVTARALELRMTPEIKAKLTQPADGANGVAGRIALEDMQQILHSKLFADAAYKSRIYTACEAKIEADRLLAQVDGSKVEEEPDEAAEDDRDPADVDAAKLVKQQVNVQMATAGSPEEKLQDNVEKRADPARAAKSIQSLSLRDGASDVTAFHDFTSLQIAFQHVWQQIFDKDLAALGKELYEEYVNIDYFNYRDPRYLPVSTVDDLKKLMDEIRKLMAQTQNVLPVGLKGAATIDSMFADGGPKVKLPGIGTVGRSAPTDDSKDQKTRLYTLLESLDKILKSPYAFTVFAPRSINFGVLITYRQTWVPENYQVGELVSTIPLAPKEVRRYTTHKVVKKTRNVKELEDSLQTRRTESSDTARADAEIVDRAQNRNSFNFTAHQSLGGEGYAIDFTENALKEQSQESARTKKEFRESVVKSAQEYKQQHRMEIDSSESTETEQTIFHEIQNPNDELAVTYLFYELQRQYTISERLHKLTPVIFVANEVPRPDAITDAWLVQYDWILRRVLLDDSFRPAIDYLVKGFVGAELNIRILEENARVQKELMERINQQIQNQIHILDTDEQAVIDALENVGNQQKTKGVLDTIKGIFDPVGITGKTDDSAIVAAQSAADYAKETLDRANKEKARLLQELNVATSALQSAVDKLAAAITNHYDQVAAIDRLRVHIKENILYYMQAIWSYEPPDQRYFRIYNYEVPIVTANTAGVEVEVRPKPKLFGALFGGPAYSASLPVPELTVNTRKLVQVADIDKLLGFKGNYMIFALKENNYITLQMMQDYLEVANEITLRDPDAFGDYSVEELQRLAACLKASEDDAIWQKHRIQIRDALIERLTSNRKESEKIVVPTSSLYIEALVGTHPLLEDFKLAHRALDVKKVQAEVRHAELENIRLAARALRGKDDDPDIEKKIIIEGNVPAVIPND